MTSHLSSYQRERIVSLGRKERISRKSWRLWSLKEEELRAPQLESGWIGGKLCPCSFCASSSGLPLQQFDNLRPITTGTKLDANFCAFHGAVKVSQDVLHVHSINLPLVHCDFVSSPSHSYKRYDRIHTIRFTRDVTVRAIATVNNCETCASRRGWPSPNSCFARFNGKVILINTVGVTCVPPLHLCDWSYYVGNKWPTHQTSIIACVCYLRWQNGLTNLSLVHSYTVNQ